MRVNATRAALFGCVSFLIIAAVSSSRAASLNTEAATALARAQNATLYSLEPDPRLAPGKDELHGWRILGSVQLSPRKALVAKAILERAVKAGRTSALCFEPRQALRVTSGRDLYDYFICYSCLALVVFKNDRILQTVEVGGEPTSINELLASSHLPLSKSAEVEEAARRARSKKEAIDLKRWVMAMPLALQPIWAEDAVHDPDDFATMARNPLANEFPNERERILALLRWYGSGSGPWSGYPAYEDTLAALLFEYKTSAIVASLQSVSLNEPEMEGAARLFARFDFRQQRPKSILKLPVDLKRSLLQHCLQSKSADKVERAKRAFAQ